MAKCGNCEWFTCEHKYGEPIKGDCPKYRPHYNDEVIPIIESSSDTKTSSKQELEQNKHINGES